MGSEASIKFSCPTCQQLLKLPGAAAGRRARCGNCKGVVRVPAAAAAKPAPKPVPAASGPKDDLEDELGSFLSDMIAEDRDPDRTDGFARPKRFQRAAPRPAEEPEEEDLDVLDAAEARALRALQKRAPAATAAPDPHPRDAGPSIFAEASEPAETPATLVPAAPAAAAVAAKKPAPRPVAAGFPTNDDPGPFLAIRSISALGVRLAFPAPQLKNPLFRASFPSVCVFSGEPLGPGSYARPMVFNNHHAGGDERVRIVELRHEKTVGTHYSPAGFVEETARIEELPAPFDLALPYTVSAGHHESSLHCEAHVSGKHPGYCEVLIPSPEAALAWVGAVNGVCHPSHQLIATKGSSVSSEAWSRLPQSTRDRISMWLTFRRGERFLAYARDSHSTVKDAGLGGVLVTDQRMVFHLYRTTWSMDLAKPLTLLSRIRGETFGLAASSDGGEVKPMCNLLRGDAALVFEALEDAAEELTVETENEDMASAA